MSEPAAPRGPVACETAGARRADDDACCPVCGGEVRSVKCKVVCTRCRAIVVNCSGD